MDKGKIVAVITGVISILIAIAYLVIVQLIDFRGEMIPAPLSQLSIIGYFLHFPLLYFANNIWI